MNYAKLLLFSLCSGLLFASCGEPEKTQKPDTPIVSKDNSISISSYRSDNAVDDLYIGLLDKNPALKKLEDELVSMKTKTNLVTKNFYNYDNKSKAYYNEVDYQAASMKDSLLQKKLLAAIDSSKNQYTSKTTELRFIVNQIAENSTQLNDRHAALKILLTLPIIENFQTQQLPNNNGMNELILIQKNLLVQVDSLTPSL